MTQCIVFTTQSRNGGRDQEEGMDMDADDEDNETANDTVGGEEVRALFVDKAFRHNVLGIMEWMYLEKYICIY